MKAVKFLFLFILMTAGVVLGQTSSQKEGAPQYRVARWVSTVHTLDENTAATNTRWYRFLNIYNEIDLHYQCGSNADTISISYLTRNGSGTTLLDSVASGTMTSISSGSAVGASGALIPMVASTHYIFRFTQARMVDEICVNRVDVTQSTATNSTMFIVASQYQTQTP